MSNLVAFAKNTANELINNAYIKAADKGDFASDVQLLGATEIPKDSTNGDFAANHAMTGARALRMPPRKIAEVLAENMDLQGSCFNSVEVAGPGFLNFRLAPNWYRSVLEAIEKAGDDYGKSNTLDGEKIMVEFVSANPTGPMHMGNARGGVLGDTLAEVLYRAGAEVSREFYVNNAGNQIEKFAASIEARYLEIVLGEKAPEFPEDGYHGDDIINIARSYFDEHGAGLVNEDEKVRHSILAEYGLSINLPKMKSDLLRYGIEFDRWFFESDLYDEHLIEETIKELSSKNACYEKDGALWIKTGSLLKEKLRQSGKSEKDIEKLELKDDVLRRANGLYTYFAADIAYHRAKLGSRGFDKAINIWGADHHGHVARLKLALDVLGLDGEHRLDIVLMQLVNLMRNGEAVRMSKRTGKAISLSDLLDEIPVDAARWFFNARPDTQMDFDLDLAVRQDSDNPVYYVQYAHARLCSLIDNLKREGHSVKSIAEIKSELLNNPSEYDLIKQLALLPEEIEAAAKAYDPSKINRYITELGARFHKFYTVSRIMGAEPDILDARLSLAESTRKVIAIALNILGINAPCKM